MQKAAEDVLLQGTVGLLVGASVGIVLSRGGASGVRKAITGFGAGVGVGSAWTKCNMNLEKMLSASKTQ